MLFDKQLLILMLTRPLLKFVSLHIGYNYLCQASYHRQALHCLASCRYAQISIIFMTNIVILKCLHQNFQSLSELKKNKKQFRISATLFDIISSGDWKRALGNFLRADRSYFQSRSCWQLSILCNSQSKRENIYTEIFGHTLRLVIKRASEAFSLVMKNNNCLLGYMSSPEMRVFIWHMCPHLAYTCPHLAYTCPQLA